MGTAVLFDDGDGDKQTPPGEVDRKRTQRQTATAYCQILASTKSARDWSLECLAGLCDICHCLP